MSGIADKRIFVQIASYRDRELPYTIKSCLENAADPERLTFGICQQYDADSALDLAPYDDDPRFRIDRIDYRESRGCCWARNRTNRLYAGEGYTLQIDAHMRFAPSWDEELVNMLALVDRPKPLLTTYPPGYTLIDGEAALSQEENVQRLGLKRLNLDLTTTQEGEPVPPSTRPGASRFIAAGYIFSLGRFCIDVEYDPEIYFNGEEISLAARAYTHGYDFFYPNKNLVWHRYSHGGPVHWVDHPDAQQKHDAARNRLDALLLHDHGVLGKYGLGPERSLKEYEEYAGISFAETAARRELGESTVPFRRTIVLNTRDIERRNDYELWIFCLLNDDDQELFRYDIVDRDFLNHERNTIRIDTELPAEPTRYMLWPKHREWGRKLFYPLDPDRAGATAGRGAQPTIFVALAAYCDPELALTIDHCLSQAVHPDRLRFGVCLQYDEDGEPGILMNCLQRFEDDPRFRIVKYPWRESLGGCWARNIAQSLYRGEDYTLQVDSHTRFLAGWDAALLGMARQLPSPKPLVTGFPPLYHRDGDEETWTDADDLARVPTTLVTSWDQEGWIHHPTRYLTGNTSRPRRTRVLSGAFVFTLGKWNHEVNQDPWHLYTGEEFALTLRSFTHGYDLFNPSHIVVWHRNHPQPNRKYIRDFDAETVRARHRHAIERLQKLLSGDPHDELAPFGLGRARSLEHYRLFSGLDCRDRTIHPDAAAGRPPDPYTIAPNVDADGASTLLEVTIHLSETEPVVVHCPHDSPVLRDLYAAVEANASGNGTGDADRLIYLGFDAPHHELYFLQSRLVYVETCAIR